MFNFLKKREKDFEAYDENGIDADDMMDGQELSSGEREVFTDLSLHPNWHLPEEEVYVYRFLNQELPPLRPNQISVYGVDVKEKDGGLIVDGFVRHSLSKAIQLKPATVLVLNQQGETIARQPFDLGNLGNIPRKSSRPWTFLFPPSSIVQKDGKTLEHDWRLALELNKKPAAHKLDLDLQWKEKLPEEKVTKLTQLVTSMSPPKKGEINFYGLDARHADNGDLHVTLLIRNGNEKDITLNYLPLRFEDASCDIVAEGGFKLKSLSVKANASKPWSFIFPADSLKADVLDLTKWRAYPIQK
ncbi:accessory Sec system S-layer assembly protein [Halobacillus trueperi]|uniref:accessory Sec system S-layer assembly protein n=1 Tax=Halobacillus trueperi TaxID=156205 RepID=UPI0037352131